MNTGIRSPYCVLRKKVPNVGSINPKYLENRVRGGVEATGEGMEKKPETAAC